MKVQERAEKRTRKEREEIQVNLEKEGGQKKGQKVKKEGEGKDEERK